MAVADYLKQQQAWQNEQRQNRMRLQSLEQAKAKGLTDARAQEASMREIMKVRTRSSWAGLQVLGVVSVVILMFAYNSIFAKNKRLFWMLTAVMVIMLVYKFVDVVREDGGLAIGHLSQ